MLFLEGGHPELVEQYHKLFGDPSSYMCHCPHGGFTSWSKVTA